MIIAIPINNKEDIIISETFGRAACFMFYDTDTKTSSIIDNNQNLNAVQGAGIQSSELIVKNNATAVIAKHCGPKAFRVLNSSNIAVYVPQDNDVDKAINDLNSNNLKQMLNADVQGHWS